MAQAKVVPARTQQVWVAQCLSELDENLQVALSLGVMTGEVERFIQVDDALRSGPFMTWVRSGAGQALRNTSLLAEDAAKVLSAVQEHFQFFAERQRPGWKFGSLSA